MSDADRLRFLKETGRAALAGVSALLSGVDVVVDPDQVEVETGIGSAIGRQALAAAEHRPGLAVRSDRGQRPDGVGEPSPTALTLAAYPTDGLPALEQALGITGEPLPPHGDLEGPATARDLAWLPLLAGWTLCRRAPAGRLLAVGGYRSAALVRFAGATPGVAAWAALGNDHLWTPLPPDRRPALYLEEPARLRDAIAAGRVGLALLGGADLAWASGLPGAEVVQGLAAPALGLDWAPAWGLFTQSRRVTWDGEGAPTEGEVVLAPAAQLPGLAAWLDGAVVT